MLNCKRDAKGLTDIMVSFETQVTFKIYLIQSKGVRPLYLPVSLSLDEFCSQETT